MVQSLILQFILFVTEILLAVNLDTGRILWAAVFIPLYILALISIPSCILSCCIRKCSVEVSFFSSSCNTTYASHFV